MPRISPTPRAGPRARRRRHLGPRHRLRGGPSAAHEDGATERVPVGAARRSPGEEHPDLARSLVGAFGLAAELDDHLRASGAAHSRSIDWPAITELVEIEIAADGARLRWAQIHAEIAALGFCLRGTSARGACAAATRAANAATPTTTSATAPTSTGRAKISGKSGSKLLSAEQAERYHLGLTTTSAYTTSCANSKRSRSEPPNKPKGGGARATRSTGTRV